MISSRARARPPASLDLPRRRHRACCFSSRRSRRGCRAGAAPPDGEKRDDEPSRADTIVEQITVTATREEERLVETPASVGIVEAETHRARQAVASGPGDGSDAGRRGRRHQRRGPHHGDPPAVHHQPGLSLPRGRHPDPLDRLLQPQRALRDQPAAGGRDRGASTARRPRSTARTRSAAWSTC